VAAFPFGAGGRLFLRAANNENDEGLGGGRRGKELFVRLVSAAGAADQPWALFYVFGQAGIHGVRLIGKVAHEEQ